MHALFIDSYARNERTLMIQGIYMASQGLTMLTQKQDQIANNLANVNTTGFKESGLFAKAFNKYLANDHQQPFANREIKADEVYVDYSEGPMRSTGNPLDVMIKGSGFFAAMTPSGVGYTRNGNFSINAEGFLVTSDGYKVMSREGYVRLDKDSPQVSFTDKGEVMQGDETKGILRIVDFEKPYKLQRIGSSCFIPVSSEESKIMQSPGFAVKQGYLEASNVNIIRNMVEMISAYRNMEADQKALTAQDDTLEKAVNSVGRL